MTMMEALSSSSSVFYVLRQLSSVYPVTSSLQVFFHIYKCQTMTFTRSRREKKQQLFSIICYVNLDVCLSSRLHVCSVVIHRTNFLLCFNDGINFGVILYRISRSSQLITTFCDEGFTIYILQLLTDRYYVFHCITVVSQS